MASSRHVISTVILYCVLTSAFAENTVGQEISGVLSYSTKGIAPIPAFTIDDGAFYSHVVISYNRWEIAPDVAYNDAQGNFWFTDIWLRYYLMKKKNYRVRASVDWATFGQSYTTNEIQVHESTRYLNFELFGDYLFEDLSSLSLRYWINNGIGDRTIDGHFFMSEYTRSLKIKPFTYTLKPGLFAVLYDGNNDGVFASINMGLQVADTPFLLTSQNTIPIKTNIDRVKHEYNVGLAYLF